MKLLISIAALILCVSCHSHKVMPNSVLIESEAIHMNKAKNIIFLIGDGMGIGQITAGTYANNNKTALERFEIVGLHKPYSGDNLVTDSAAAATSFSVTTGYVIWLLRGGTLITSMMSSIPLWQRFDPLQVINGDDSVDPSSTESLADLVESSGQTHDG